MKRRKKQNTLSNQLCLWDTPSIRQQEEEHRRKPRKKRTEATKPAVLTLVPPTEKKAARRQENGLKTEVPSKDELNAFWKEDPQALRIFSRMAKKNPAVLKLVREFSLIPKQIC